MPIKTVALLGADGKLGPSVLQALVSANFTVTVLKRASSKSKSDYPASVREVRIPDEFPPAALEEALKGQDVVVATVSGSKTELQRKLADAAVAAGVQRFIPADFGSCEAGNERAKELVPFYYVEKLKLRRHLQDLAEKNPGFSWTALVCGHFFDWEPKFLHIDIAARRAALLDDGNVKASASTLGQVGKATAKVLESADKAEMRNRTLYVQSFCVTQRQVLEAFERATGTKWEVEMFDSAKFLADQRAKMDAGDKNAMEEVVWWLGTLEADWESEDGFAMSLLGLEEENLDEVVKRMVE